eukprot:214333_1
MTTDEMYDQYDQWFKDIKRKLLESEPQNIAIRTQHCETVINDAVKSLNTTAANQLPNQLPSIPRYRSRVDILKHLQFLSDWPGLRISHTSIRAPRTRKEYEKKSKNWLNGRRAPNYSRTLFPYFITDAERYSLRIAQLMHPHDNRKQSLYCKCLIHNILARLCGTVVSLNDQAKKAPFFCKNSMQRKGVLRDILQSYATDHPYVQGFPSCFEEAVDHFTKKSNEYMAQYQEIECKQVQESKQSCDDDGKCQRDVIVNKERETCQKYDTLRTHCEIDVATFWKTHALELQQQINNEKQQRIKAEEERDRLLWAYNMLSPNVMNTCSAYGGSYVNITAALNTVQKSAAKDGIKNEKQSDVGETMVAALFDILRTNS